MSGIFQEADERKGVLGQFYVAKEFEKLSQLYTDDCIFMPPDQPILRGRQSIIAAANQMWENGIRKVETKTVEAVEIGDDMAYSTGLLTFYLEDGKVVFNGKFFVLWKRVDGKLQMVSDTFNATK